MRHLNDPTHGITVDPVTGRRYVLAYVELGRRAVEGLHRENRRGGETAIVMRAASAAHRYFSDNKGTANREGRRWTA